MATLLVHPAAPALADLLALLDQPTADEASARRLPPRRDLFNEIVGEAIRTSFDTKTARGIQYIIKAYSIGFGAAKAGELSTAEVEFARADALLALHRDTLSGPALAFINCLTLPYWAYFDYSRGRYDDATAQTQAAIANIIGLEDQIEVFHMARIQQLHNITRVSFKRGDAAGGATLVHALLAYLSAGVAPALSGGWAPALLARTPPTLRADMFSQVFVEMASLLLYPPDLATRRQLFATAFGQLSTLAGAIAEWPTYQAWLEAYEALLFGKASDYAPLLAAYLATEPSHVLDLLTLTLLLELRRVASPAAAPADLAPRLHAYARRTLWLAERHLALLA
jgi:hypothetical protein